MRLWDKRDSFVALSSCAGKPDFIVAPEDLGPKRTAAVVATCEACPVRVECIEWATVDRFEVNRKGVTNRIGGQENSVWVAGEWLPDTYTAANRRELEAKRKRLVGSLPLEAVHRLNEVL